MKTLLLFISATVLSFQLSAQWTQANLGGSKAITFHNGKIFALTSTMGLQVSINNGTSWSLVNTDTITGRKDHLVSAANRLYIATFDPLTANGNIYYSLDEGLTWQTDTVGLPNASQANAKTDIHTIVAYGNGELIVTCSGLDAYYHKNIVDAAWEIIPSLASLDPEDYIGSGDTVLAFGSSPTIKISLDNAHTFTDLVATGLPGYFVPSGIYWDRGQRMYLGVDAPILNKTQFYYSDDKGASWDTFNIAPFVGVNFISQRQKLTAVFGLDNYVTFALYNDQSNTTADIFSSTDAGASFVKDTAGLAVDGFPTEFVTAFMYNNQRLFSVNSNTDIHYKALNGPTTAFGESISAQSIEMYPNPTNGVVHFTSAVKSVRILNINGSVIREYSDDVDLIDVSNQLSGLYLIEWVDNHGFLQRQKLILK